MSVGGPETNINQFYGSSYYRVVNQGDDHQHWTTAKLLIHYS